MVDVRFMAYDDDDGIELARARLGFVPRRGETVVLDNLRLRVDEDKPIDEQRVAHVTTFVVDDVAYEMDAHHTDGTETTAAGERVKGGPVCEDEVVVQVWLVLPPCDRTWAGLDRA